MRIVFMGTPTYAATILDNLCQAHTVLSVLTNKDSVRGRGNKVSASPVKQCAHVHDVPVFEPDTLRDASVVEHLQSLDADVFVVAAYGKILPPNVLAIPALGCLNVHASLLPRWRGAAPIERAILAGDGQTGVCIMRMEAGLDTGDVCDMRICDIGNKSLDDLTRELSQLGSRALMSSLDQLEHNTLRFNPQDDDESCYAHKIAPHELDINQNDSAILLVRKVQASSKAHPACMVIDNKRVRITQACVLGRDDSVAKRIDQLVNISTNADVSHSVVRIKSRLFVTTCSGIVELISVWPQSKKHMSAAGFVAGLHMSKTTVLHWGACT